MSWCSGSDDCLKVTPMSGCSTGVLYSGGLVSNGQERELIYCRRHRAWQMSK
ncbi:hypothetical protein PM082_024055 [Marasmius tenuissimus]|nr:hypothetical protein PM082_024055 [Marasmius tenuissimus]